MSTANETLEMTLPLGRQVTYRGMTGREEELLTNQRRVQSGDAVAELVARCVVSLDGVGQLKAAAVDALETPDRVALLCAIRRASYGDTMETELKCPACRTKFSLDVDLSQLESKPAPGTYIQGSPFETTLPSGETVKFQYLNGVTERKLLRATTERITSMMLLRIVEVEGVHENDYRKWLLDLPVKSRSALRDAMLAVECGLVSELKADCPSCGEEVAFEAMGQPGFFFPGA